MFSEHYHVSLEFRHSEFRFFPVPDRFINRQTVLFYEKRIFSGPKNGTFYLSN